MSDTSEFSRPFKLRRLGVHPVETSVEADPGERERVAGRLGLPGVARLECRYRLTPGDGRSIMVEGWLVAEMTQVSVISDEPFDDAATESFILRLLPETEVLDADFIDLDAPDVVPYAGDAIDLGEIACEQLALTLDPYPRRPGEGLAEAVDAVPGTEDAPSGAPGGQSDDAEAQPHPFAALARRREGGH